MKEDLKSYFSKCSFPNYIRKIYVDKDETNLYIEVKNINAHGRIYRTVELLSKYMEKNISIIDILTKEEVVTIEVIESLPDYRKNDIILVWEKV